MTIEQFNATVRADLDRKINAHNLQGSNKNTPNANVSHFGNRNNLSRNMNSKNGRNKNNFSKQNIKKKEHCPYCGKLGHYKRFCRNKIADDKQ